jgi:hypothetical protein
VRVTYDSKLKRIILPRQARDNHRKSCEKEWRYIYIIHNDDHIRICIQVLEGDMGGPLLEIIESLSPLASRCDYIYSTKQARTFSLMNCRKTRAILSGEMRCVICQDGLGTNAREFATTKPGCCAAAAVVFSFTRSSGLLVAMHRSSTSNRGLFRPPSCHRSESPLFPYVCPEPVLANRRHVWYELVQRDAFQEKGALSCGTGGGTAWVHLLASRRGH